VLDLSIHTPKRASDSRARKPARWRPRLNENGGKVDEMPSHHTLEAYLGVYMHAAALFGAKGTRLFRRRRGTAAR
jgi:hypothetical protein